MRIVVVGAGAVGSYLADRLSAEGQDVVVIESDPARAREIQDRVDALVLSGNGASDETLRQAGAQHADLVVAVSNSDGVNVLACHTAHRLGVDRTVARIEAPELRPGLGELGVDVVIDPGEMAAQEVVSLVSQRGVFDVIEFAGGSLTLVGGIAREGSPLVGRTVAEIRASDVGAEFVVTAVVRGGVTIPVRGATTIEENDHVLLMVETADLGVARVLLGLSRDQARRTIILGSTRVAELAAEMVLDRGLDVVIIDPDGERGRLLADRHPRALVLEGDPTNPSILRDLNLVKTDVIAALSGWDEVNLTGCLVGKALGAGTAISRFHRLAYVNLLLGTGIDAAVSSRLSAVNAILRFIRRGRIRSVATFKDTQAEAMEIEVEAASAVDGQLLRDVDLPPLAVVGGIGRDGGAFVPSGSTEIRVKDRLIVFAPPEAVTLVEQMCTA